MLRPLDPAAVVVGEGFRFGHRARGNATTLAAAGFDVREVDLTGVVVHGHQAPVSSSSIRYALDAGDVESAAAMLGRPHRVDGIVVRGDQRGRALLGFPRPPTCQWIRPRRHRRTACTQAGSPGSMH